MRKRIAALLGVIVTVAAVVSAVALAKPSMTPMSIKASLDSRQETPRPKGEPVRAGGTFTATLTGKKLKWKLEFSHLSGPAVAAHIHAGKRGVAGAVLIALCGANCKSGVSGASVVSAAVAKQIESGDTYVNVHTAKNPGGEIRGQLKSSM
jgi:hypothetical protein